MLRVARLQALLILLVMIPLGCSASTKSAPFDPSMFGATSMRIHPIFTQIDDWTGDGKNDGIEALIEFQDPFGDPCKAAGTVIFEVFAYRPYHPDPRGPRVVEPFIGSTKTMEDQQARWNRTSRTYQFQLASPDIRPGRSYVLSASFDYGGGRFFDQVVIDAQTGTRRADPPEPARDPAASQPAE